MKSIWQVIRRVLDPDKVGEPRAESQFWKNLRADNPISRRVNSWELEVKGEAIYVSRAARLWEWRWVSVFAVTTIGVAYYWYFVSDLGAAYTWTCELESAPRIFWVLPRIFQQMFCKFAAVFGPLFGGVLLTSFFALIELWIRGDLTNSDSEGH